MTRQAEASALVALALLPLWGCGSARMQSLAYGRSAQEEAIGVATEVQASEQTLAHREVEQAQGQSALQEEWLVEEWASTDSLRPHYRAMRLRHVVSQVQTAEHQRAEALEAREYEAQRAGAQILRSETLVEHRALAEERKRSAPLTRLQRIALWAFGALALASALWGWLRYGGALRRLGWLGRLVWRSISR